MTSRAKRVPYRLVAFDCRHSGCALWRILRLILSRPAWNDRDRFILSKGHACAALYAVLAERGFYPCSDLDTFYQNGTKFAGHTMHNIPGVELSAGSLGHGLPVATGMALAAKRDGKSVPDLLHAQ